MLSKSFQLSQYLIYTRCIIIQYEVQHLRNEMLIFSIGLHRKNGWIKNRFVSSNDWYAVVYVNFQIRQWYFMNAEKTVIARKNGLIMNISKGLFFKQHSPMRNYCHWSLVNLILNGSNSVLLYINRCKFKDHEWILPKLSLFLIKMKEYRKHIFSNHTYTQLLDCNADNVAPQGSIRIERKNAGLSRKIIP